MKVATISFVAIGPAAKTGIALRYKTAAKLVEERCNWAGRENRNSTRRRVQMCESFFKGCNWAGRENRNSTGATALIALMQEQSCNWAGRENRNSTELSELELRETTRVAIGPAAKTGIAQRTESADV